MPRNAEKALVWTGVLHEAAAMVADGRLTNREISERVGRSESTIDFWIAHPDFKSRVAALVTKLARKVEESFVIDGAKLAIADRNRRLQRINDDWLNLQLLKERRGEHFATNNDAEPGADTGLLVKKTKFYGQGDNRTEIVEYHVDGSLLAQQAALELQAARELGQLGPDSNLNVNVKLYGGFDPEAV